MHVTDSNRIEIPLSKTKLIKLLAFSILFLAGGLWMVITNPQTSNPIFNNVVVKTIASYGSAIMGLFGIYFFTKKLSDKNAGLILDDQGCYDNTSAFKFGLIPWSDIADIYENSIHSSIASKQHFVTIALIDPEKYISKEPNILKRKLLGANLKGYGSPIHISTSDLKISHQELLELMKKYLGEHRSID